VQRRIHGHYCQQNDADCYPYFPAAAAETGTHYQFTTKKFKRLLYNRRFQSTLPQVLGGAAW